MFILIHSRAHCDSLEGSCAAKSSEFDFEKFENSIIPIEGACAPMLGNRVCIFLQESELLFLLSLFPSSSHMAPRYNVKFNLKVM